MRYSKTALTLGVLTATAALLLTGCATSGNSTNGSTKAVTQAEIDKAMNTPTTLNFWTWITGNKKAVALFEKKYPKIKVNVSNVGSGTVAYTKTRTAIAAGQAPDVAQFEYAYLPAFESKLLDLTPYGAGSEKSKFVPAVWGQVSSGSSVYAIPEDFAPMGNMYRADIFKTAGVAEPQTWTDFETAAKTIKDKTGSYITDLAPDASQFEGLLWQGGAKPFGFDGKKTVTVDLTSPAATKVTDYWNTLIKENLVATDADFTNDWYQGLSNGKYASWLGAAWGPTILSGSAAPTAGKWQLADLPQWTAGTSASGFWGGSSNAVLKGSKNPIAAYELAKFISTDAESSMTLATTEGEFPPLLSTLHAPSFLNQPNTFFGGQKLNQKFSDIAATIDPDFPWLPFNDYVTSSFVDTLGKAIANKTDLDAGLKAWQAAIVTYAKQQGYTVKTN